MARKLKNVIFENKGNSKHLKCCEMRLFWVTFKHCDNLHLPFRWFRVTMDLSGVSICNEGDDDIEESLSLWTFIFRLFKTLFNAWTSLMMTMTRHRKRRIFLCIIILDELTLQSELKCLEKMYSHLASIFLIVRLWCKISISDTNTGNPRYYSPFQLSESRMQRKRRSRIPRDFSNGSFDDTYQKKN